MKRLLTPFILSIIFHSSAFCQNPVVQLRASDCGLFDFNTNDVIRSTNPANISAVAYYQWRFEEVESPFTVYEIIAPNGNNPNFRIKWFEEIQYGKTYEVSVRVAINPGAVVEGYGPSCIIGLQDDVLTSGLEEQYSGDFVSYCDVIGATAVGAADRYRWTFTDFQNPDISVYGDGDERLLRVSKANLRLGQNYVVRVFAEVNGLESPEGTIRFIAVNNFVPNTGLRQDLFPCGGTYPINTQVQAVEVCSAENYTWRFKNISQPQADILYTRVGGNRFIRLDWLDNLIVGDTYDVDVKARQGAKNGDYSSVCTITIGTSTAPNAGLWQSPLSVLRLDGPTAVADKQGIDMVAYGKTQDSGGGILIDILNTNSDNDVRFQVYDMSGKLMDERMQRVGADGTIIDWHVPGISPGIYILRASDGLDMKSTKISIF